MTAFAQSIEIGIREGRARLPVRLEKDLQMSSRLEVNLHATHDYGRATHGAEPRVDSTDHPSL
jgi:hypothetical protein